MKDRIIEIEEVCSNCDELINTNWNIEKYGYIMYCPFCGTKMYICNQCERCSESNCSDAVCPAKIQELLKYINDNIVEDNNKQFFLNEDWHDAMDIANANIKTPLYIAESNIEIFIDDYLETPIHCGCETIEEVYNKYQIETIASIITKIKNKLGDRIHLTNTLIYSIIVDILNNVSGESVDDYLKENSEFFIEIYRN